MVETRSKSTTQRERFAQADGVDLRRANAALVPAARPQEGDGLGAASAPGTITISVSANPSVLRALVTFLGSFASSCSQFKVSVPSAGQVWASSDASSLDTPRLAGGPFQELSRNAERLLATLVTLRRRCEQNRCPDEAWVTKSVWFQAARLDRRRADGPALIAELMEAGLVKDRLQGKAGKWRQYRSTNEGAQYVAQPRS